MRNVIALCVVAMMASVASAAVGVGIVGVDNSAQLTGWVSQDVVFTTDTDWISSQMLITLTEGTVYQDDMGGITSPNPAWFTLAPTLEFDTYVSNGVVGDPLSAEGGAVNLGGDATLSFDEVGLNVNWFTTSDADTGALALARVTMSDTAQGEWQVWMSAVNEQGDDFLVITGGPVENGVMVPEPATLSVLALGGLALIRRKK